MLKQDGIIMLSEMELEKIIKDKIGELEEKVKDLETGNEFLRKAILSLTTKNNQNHKKVKDVRVSKVDFLKIYDNALNNMFDNPEVEDDGIYGYDITVHWHGIYCNCSDGAVPSNYIIPAIRGCIEEENEEYEEN